MHPLHFHHLPHPMHPLHFQHPLRRPNRRNTQNQNNSLLLHLCQTHPPRHPNRLPLLHRPVRRHRILRQAILKPDPQNLNTPLLLPLSRN